MSNAVPNSVGAVPPARAETPTQGDFTSLVTTQPNSETRASHRRKSTSARELVMARSVIDENGCWNWTGNIQGAAGYGRVHVGRPGCSYEYLGDAS